MASTRRDLFLQVSASTDSMQAALKAGRSALAQFGATAGDTASEIQKNFANMGGGNIEATARSIDAAFSKTFANIRANQQKILDMPAGNAAFQVLNAGAAQQNAAAAEAQAAGLRLVADAAAKAADATTGDATAARVYATAAEAAAVGAERQATALRTQANVLGGVRTQLEAAGVAEEELSGSHTRMGASGMIAEHVVRSLSDSIASGQSPARALGMEMGRITEAMTLFAATTNSTEGAVGRFAKFMGGPYGLAVSVGVAVLTPLVGKLFEMNSAADDGVAKLRQHAEETKASAQAADIFKKSEEGLEEAIHDQNKELEKSLATQKEQEQQALRNARNNYQEALSIRSRLQAKLEEAEADLRVQQERAAGPGQQGDLAAMGLPMVQGRVDQVRADLASNQAAIGDAQRGIRDAEIPIAVRTAKNNVDPIAHLNDLYDDMAQKAKHAAQGNDALAASLDKTLTKIEQQRKAAIEAEQAREREQRRSASDNRQVGRQIDLAQAESIVQAVGGRITSAQRSTAEQQVLYDRYKAGTGSLAAKPGTSEHERGQALDVAKAAGITLAALKKAFADQGVHLTEALDEGNHYHVAWGPKGPSADAIARRDRAADVKEANQDGSFQSALKSALDGLAAAQSRQPQTPQQEYDTTAGRLQDDLIQRSAAIEDQVDAGKLTAAQALEILAIMNHTEQLDKETASRKLLADSLEQQMSATQAATNAQLGILQLKLGLAKDPATKYGTAQLILEANQKQHRAELLQTLDANSGADSGKRADATAELQTLDQKEDLQRKDLAREYQNPLQAYGQQLQSNVGDMNTALKGVEADGLKGLEDGLTGILTGTKSVAGAFKEMATSIIADLARIAIEKAIISFIPGLKDGGKIATFATGGLPGFASGGDPTVSGGIIQGAGTGRSDSILALVGGKKPIMVSNGEGIVNEQAVRKWWPEIDAMNKGTFEKFASGGLVSPSQIYMRKLPAASSIQRAATSGGHPITFDLRNAVMTEDLLKQMNSIAAQYSTVSIIAGSQMAQQDMADHQMAAIP